MATGLGMRFALSPRRNVARPMATPASRTHATIHLVRLRLKRPRGRVASIARTSGREGLVPDIASFLLVLFPVSVGGLKPRPPETEIRNPILVTVFLIGPPPSTFLIF